MRALVLTGILGFVAGGIVFAAWYPSAELSPVAAVSSIGATPQSSDTASLEQRVAALEAALVIERDARQLLEEELFYLSDLQSGDDRATPDANRPQPVGVVDAAQAGEGAGSVRRRSSSRDPEARRARLVDNGFSPQEADEILRRESELQMASLQARYEARLKGERASIPSSSAVLREELGDDAYGRYLEANGRQISVTVSSIFEGSPALNAGMRPGDEIVRYDGNRVFSMNDISRYVMEGAPGENVTVEVMRNGLVMQLAIPRGPLGVSGGRRSSR